MTAPRRPNVVLVMLDDFSMDLLRTMRSAQTMRERGASYRHSYVVDSLCCVSRASTFTGQYPHQTGVRTNVSETTDTADPVGGWPAFQHFGNPRRSVNVRLQEAGYTTGYVGKYLNEFEYKPGGPVPPRPPGWDDLRVVFGSAYDGWDFYTSRVDGGRLVVDHTPAPPADVSPAVKDAAYAGTVIEGLALDFIAQHEAGRTPYFLQVAPYAPHARVNALPHYAGDPLFPPAFRDRPTLEHPAGNCGALPCGRLGVRDLPGYADQRRDNRPRLADGRPGPDWLAEPRGLRPAVAVATLRNRARMAQSADRLVQGILDTVGDDTYVVLTSDNGFHLGQLGLSLGKGTPYSPDVQVPLLVVGPGVPAGARGELATNLDLAPTLEDLAGLRPASFRSGASLVPSLRDPKAQRRAYVFHEHSRPAPSAADPDHTAELGVIPSYVAVRSRTRLLARFDLASIRDRGAGTRYVYELYDLTRDRFERTNVYGRPRYADDVAVLRARLRAFDACTEVAGNDPVRGACRRLDQP